MFWVLGTIYKTDPMFEKVRNEYVEMNGEPKILCIELFEGLRAFERAECSGSIVLKK